jgi:hypothetical protein
LLCEFDDEQVQDDHAREKEEEISGHRLEPEIVRDGRLGEERAHGDHAHALSGAGHRDHITAELKGECHRHVVAV